MSAPGPERHLQWARAQDQADPLAHLRSRFAIPRAAEGNALLYLCGHSLGLAPIDARATLMAEISAWEQLGVLGHEAAAVPWIDYAEQFQPALAQLAGAHSDEVVAMNSLSINLHLLLASFYRPQGVRRAILIEAGAFSSDRHVVSAQLAWHGLDPAHELIELAPRAGEDLLRTEDIEARIAETGPRLALVLWPGVQFRTGQWFDLARITHAAHAAGALVGFDLAHAIGNVPLALHAQKVDFAAWCSYKYLNAGPGAIAGAFIHQRHWQRRERPWLAGWWSHERSSRFAMSAQLEPAHGAAAWAVSNPPIFAAAPLRASLPLFAQAGMTALRAKSVALTDYLAALLEEFAGHELQLITGADASLRGCQLSLRLRDAPQRAERVREALARSRLVCDWREPDILRLAPVPLYNRFEDVLLAALELQRILADQR